jgi:hypothetical protein
MKLKSSIMSLFQPRALSSEPTPVPTRDPAADDSAAHRVSSEIWQDIYALLPFTSQCALKQTCRFLMETLHRPDVYDLGNVQRPGRIFEEPWIQSATHLRAGCAVTPSNSDSWLLNPQYVSGIRLM